MKTEVRLCHIVSRHDVIIGFLITLTLKWPSISDFEPSPWGILKVDNCLAVLILFLPLLIKYGGVAVIVSHNSRFLVGKILICCWNWALIAWDLVLLNKFRRSMLYNMQEGLCCTERHDDSVLGWMHMGWNKKKIVRHLLFRVALWCWNTVQTRWNAFYWISHLSSAQNVKFGPKKLR